VAPEPEPEPEVEVEPEIAAAAEPEPEPEPPPPPPQAPAAAQALDGTYVGRISGRPGSLSIAFGPDGVVTARVQRSDGEGTVNTTAVGDYTLSGSTATVMLMEQSGAEPLVYSGTIAGGEGQGRLTAAGRSRGRFSVRR
jgi:hypothetical protein